MDFLSFIIEVEAITISGALSPGPLTVSAASLWIKSGKRAGFLISLGHMTFELPLVLFIAGGLSIVPQSFKSIISLIGGVFLIYFALTQMMSLRNRGLGWKGECLPHWHNADSTQPLLHNLVVDSGD